MENASKALLIAAGVLVAVMLLAVVLVFWDGIAGYFTEAHDATRLQQLIKFNSKFDNYNNKTIRGNELVSIMNSIIDYNNLQADMEGFDRIEIEIDLKGHKSELQDEKANWHGTSSFPSNIIRNTPDDSNIKAISELSATLLIDAKANLPWLTETRLQKLSSEIAWIAYDNLSEKALEDYTANRLAKLKEILPMVSEADLEAQMSDIIEATCLYNEFTQFKRAIFKCTEIGYNSTENGRVNRMEFEVVTEIDPGTGDEKIKFD